MVVPANQSCFQQPVCSRLASGMDKIRMVSEWHDSSSALECRSIWLIPPPSLPFRHPPHDPPPRPPLVLQDCVSPSRSPKCSAACCGWCMRAHLSLLEILDIKAADHKGIKFIHQNTRQCYSNCSCCCLNNFK